LVEVISTSYTSEETLADKKKLKYWTPVDWYNGGMEHTTLHLLYSRFWHKFLYDIGVVPTSEPYAKRTSHGLILGEDGEENVQKPPDGLGAEDFWQFLRVSSWSDVFVGKQGRR
jgi:leucyl-tRNA synthetase